MLSAEQLQTYLHREIPLAGAMQLVVETMDANRVRLSAPLGENRNGHGTAFGGAIGSLATLSCWSLLYNQLLEMPTENDLVISKSTINFLAPIRGEFSAEARLPDNFSQASIDKQLLRGRRTRISVTSTVHADGKRCAVLVGEFAVLPRRAERNDN